MTKHNWKPGDVALVEVGCSANRRVAFRTGVGGNMGWEYADEHNGEPAKNCASDNSGIVTPVRPLVVIDPENPDVVARLSEILLARSAPDPDSRVARLAEALREFAIPRIDEPTGWGAVVVDDNGLTWARWAGATEACPWRLQGGTMASWNYLKVSSADQIKFAGVQ